MNAYEEDLAYIHDAGFGEFARNAAPGLLRLLADCGIENDTVVDLGCGSGIWARALSDAGYDVIGVDISPAMISLAGKRAPAARFHVGSCLSFDIPPCRAVTALGEVLNYRSDAKKSRVSLKRLFRRIHAALQPNGLFVFDLAEPGRQEATPPKFVEGPDGEWLVCVAFHTDRRHNRLTRRIVTFRKIGGTYRRSEETHELQLYAAKDVAAALRDTGFRVRVRRSYGEMPLLPHTAAFIARKP